MNKSEQMRAAGIAKHGSEEAWRKFQSESAKRAGPATKPKGFAYLQVHSPAKLRKISSKGGKASAKPTNKVVQRVVGETE